MTVANEARKLDAGRPIPLDDTTERLNGEGAGPALLVVGPAGGEVHALPRTGVVSIGRSPECDVVLEEATLSRQHAEILLGRTPRLRDLGSVNGTRISNRPLTPYEPAPIAFGQAIELGNVVVVLHQPRGQSPAPARRRPSRPHPPRDDDNPVYGEASDTVVVRDTTMSRLYAMIDRVAPSELSVLLQGETGVGKEIVAQTIHSRSRRNDGPFIRINCSAIAETLVEAELFGYVRGAFTGAHRDKPGLIEAADGGTLLLDEVGELSPAVQAKLLRVLESRRVKRVGGLDSCTVDVRFVAATNRDLKAEAEVGTFRADLYYRLNGITLHVPPLRERRAEIGPLARRFAELADARPLSDAVVAILEGHHWPGNVRELKNAIARAAVLAGSAPIGRAHLPVELFASTAVATAPTATHPSAASLRSEVEALEKQRILDALERCSGNQTRAAALLGMPRRTFVKRLDAYDIPRPRKHRK